MKKEYFELREKKRLGNGKEMKADGRIIADEKDGERTGNSLFYFDIL